MKGIASLWNLPAGPRGTFQFVGGKLGDRQRLSNSRLFLPTNHRVRNCRPHMDARPPTSSVAWLQRPHFAGHSHRGNRRPFPISRVEYFPFHTRAAVVTKRQPRMLPAGHSPRKAGALGRSARSSHGGVHGKISWRTAVARWCYERQQCADSVEEGGLWRDLRRRWIRMGGATARQAGTSWVGLGISFAIYERNIP